MHDIPLNDTQRIFADKNHNLVYKFLHEKNLPASEYYDIVIFGYLRAVQRYLTDPNLAGYSFATVAWRAMEGEVVNTHRTDKRRFRVIRFVRPRQSYTGHLTRHSTPTVTDEEALRESEVALLLHALAKRVTPQQMEIIRLRTKGYQTNEIDLGERLSRAGLWPRRARRGTAVGAAGRARHRGRPQPRAARQCPLRRVPRRAPDGPAHTAARL